MSDYDSRLENMSPLGKSVEEVEQDNQNRVNSSTLTEDDRGGDGLSFVPVVNSNLSSVPNVGGPVAATLGATDGAQANSPTVSDDERENAQS